MLEPWHNQAHTGAPPAAGGVHERGDCNPDIDIDSSDAPPLTRNALQFRSPRDSRLPWKASRRFERPMLQSTCLEFEPLAASAPSCDGARALHVPTLFPCAHENRASSTAVYCADGRLAFPFDYSRCGLGRNAATYHVKVKQDREIGQDISTTSRALVYVALSAKKTSVGAICFFHIVFIASRTAQSFELSTRK